MKAFTNALEETVDFLVTKKGLDPYEAYSLAAIDADCRVSQVVAIRKGVRCMLQVELLDQLRVCFDEAVGIGEVLQSLGAASSWIGTGAELLAEQVELADDAQLDRTELQLLRPSDRGRERSIVRELDGRLLGTNPVRRRCPASIA